VQSVAATVVGAVDLGTTNGAMLRAVTLAPGTDAAAQAALLRQNPAVADVQPVHYRSLASDGVANDQYLDNVDQWYLYKTNVDSAAWALSHGSAPVSVAVIDTGVDETNPDFVFDVKERIVGGVKATGNGVVQDTNGHGTNTSGLATAATNNSYGFAGVGYATHLQAYDIFPPATAASDCTAADTADEAAAIRDAVANGASVISLSLGSPQSKGSDAGEQAAVAFALAGGVAVVAAAGNEFGKSADGNQPDFPAAYPGVIAVGASGVTNLVANTYASITAETVASYSNSGPTLVAPGGDATSTSDNDFPHWIEGYSTTTAAFAADRCTNAGGVCRVLFNGTSQATPQVAGTITLMEAYHGGPRSLARRRCSRSCNQTPMRCPGSQPRVRARAGSTPGTRTQRRTRSAQLSPSGRTRSRRAGAALPGRRRRSAPPAYRGRSVPRTRRAAAGRTAGCRGRRRALHAARVRSRARPARRPRS
jgi:subtilisin family serine protease